MSNKVLKKLLKVSSLCECDKITIWTESFVAKGILLKEHSDIIEDVVTLKNVTIHSIGCKCDENNTCGCTSEEKELEWLNIFEDKIVGFSFLK